FDRWGVAAWGDGYVPHYVTCNPWIARAYARVLLGWLRDARAALAPGEPAYLLELGAGSGRFAHQLLHALVPAWRTASLRDVPLRYVMTDITERNLTFWSEHSALGPFQEAGVLDFALFDPVEDRELCLRLSGAVLAPGAVANPVAAVANYLFDCLPNDSFAVRAGRLHERLLTITCDPPVPEPGAPEMFRRLVLRYEERPVAGGDYYEDEPAWNGLLSAYADRLDNTVLLFPVAGLGAWPICGSFP